MKRTKYEEGILGGYKLIYPSNDIDAIKRLKYKKF